MKTRNNLVILLASVLLIGLISINAYASQYDSLGRKDPFVPLVGVAKAPAEYGIEGILTSDDVVLQGIVVNPSGGKSVIMNGELIAENEKKGIVFVEKIEDNQVSMIIDDERYVLKLYE